MEVSDLFTNGIIVFLVHPTSVLFCVIGGPALSLLFVHVYFVLQKTM